MAAKELCHFIKAGLLKESASTTAKLDGTGLSNKAARIHELGYCFILVAAIVSPQIVSRQLAVENAIFQFRFVPLGRDHEN
jgi:hypothetical protein